jgi:recombination protein RecR
MHHLPKAFQELLHELTRLPGIGRRGAERIAIHLLESPPDQAGALAAAVENLHGRVRRCDRCANWSEEALCAICADPRRDASLLCVVERPGDLWAFEHSEGFNGLYHILGGTLSPLAGVTAEDLRIDSLERRIRDEAVAEVILATSPSIDGDATAHYLARRLAPLGARLTRIAQGVPLGGHLDYADAGTLRLALQGRRPMDSGRD